MVFRCQEKQVLTSSAKMLSWIIPSLRPASGILISRAAGLIRRAVVGVGFQTASSPFHTWLPTKKKKKRNDNQKHPFLLLLRRAAKAAERVWTESQNSPYYLPSGQLRGAHWWLVPCRFDSMEQADEACKASMKEASRRGYLREEKAGLRVLNTAEIRVLLLRIRLSDAETATRSLAAGANRRQETSINKNLTNATLESLHRLSIKTKGGFDLHMHQKQEKTRNS